MLIMFISTPLRFALVWQHGPQFRAFICPGSWLSACAFCMQEYRLPCTHSHCLKNNMDRISLKIWTGKIMLRSHLKESTLFWQPTVLSRQNNDAREYRGKGLAAVCEVNLGSSGACTWVFSVRM